MSDETEAAPDGRESGLESGLKSGWTAGSKADRNAASMAGPPDRRRTDDDVAASAATPRSGVAFGLREAALVFAVALALRLAHLWFIRDMPFVEVPIVDAQAYDAWGQRIAAGDWWGDAVFYQAPLYPYFLGAYYALFGHHLMGVHVLQMAMGAASCVMVGLATSALFRDRAMALTAGLALALYPPAIFFDGLIGKQGLGLLLLSSMLWLWLRQQERVRPLEVVAAGGLLGLLCLTRENALALVPAFVPWICWRFWAQGRRKVALLLVLFAAGLAVVLLPVGLRNLAVGDTFALTTSQMGPNFYIGNHEGASGLYEPLLPGRQTPTFEASDAELLAERELGRELTRGEVSDYWMSKGLAFVREQPGAWLELLARKALLTWTAFEIPDVEDVYVYADWSPVLRHGLPLYHFAWLAALFAGGLVFATRQRRDVGLLVWLALVYTGSVALFMTFARFRYPLVPMLLPIVACGLVETVRAASRQGWRELVAPGAAFALVFVVTSFEWFDREGMKVVSYTNLGGIMLTAERLDEAELYLLRAEAARPESADLQLHLAVLREAQGRPEEALQHLATMGRLAPDDHRGYVVLARILDAEGRKAEAWRARLRARALNPDRRSGRSRVRGAAPPGRAQDERPAPTRREAAQPERNSSRLPPAGGDGAP